MKIKILADMDEINYLNTALINLIIVHGQCV